MGDANARRPVSRKRAGTAAEKTICSRGERPASLTVEPLEARLCFAVVAPTGVSAYISYRQAPDGATDKAVIRWTDNNTTETGYRVDYWNDVTRAWAPIPGGDAPANSTYATHVLDAGQQLYYRVRAVEGTSLSPESPSVVPTTPKSRVVRVSATRGEGVTNLNWPSDANAMAYRVYAKERGGSTWTLLTPSPLPAYAQGFAHEVPDGVALEYRVERDTANFYGTAPGIAYGYAYAGGKVELNDSRGRALLVVDQSLAPLISWSLSRFRKDLLADGWAVTQMTAPRDNGDAHAAVTLKADVQRYAAAVPGGIQSIILIGHVPVPYSGTTDWDGHPDHAGAWPADAYYGESIGISRPNSGWTDTGNTPNASNPQNSNVPGDGKFDQSSMPYDQNVPVGRIDFANLPSAVLSLPSPAPTTAPAIEAALIARYLAKDHSWRAGEVDVSTQALVDDHLGGGAPESAWRSFAPLVGSYNVYSRDWDSTLHGTDTYLWAYGDGPAGDGGVSGVTSTTPLESPTAKSNVVFTGLFGSWLGDWNRSGNLMRQMLASPGLTLTSAWIGAPGWNLHTMGLGETIGQATMLTINNGANGPYAPAMVGLRGPQIALMGDPTLTMTVAKPVSNLAVTSLRGRNTLSWSAAPGNVAGYLVYRATSSQGPFVRLTANPLPATAQGTFADQNLPDPAGQYTYMVRAMTLQTTASGSFYNFSAGVRVTSVPPDPPIALRVVDPSTGTSSSTRWSGVSSGDDDAERLPILSSATDDAIL